MTATTWWSSTSSGGPGARSKNPKSIATAPADSASSFPSADTSASSSSASASDSDPFISPRRHLSVRFVVSNRRYVRMLIVYLVVMTIVLLASFGALDRFERRGRRLYDQKGFEDDDQRYDDDANVRDDDDDDVTHHFPGVDRIRNPLSKELFARHQKDLKRKRLGKHNNNDNKNNKNNKSKSKNKMNKDDDQKQQEQQQQKQEEKDPTTRKNFPRQPQPQQQQKQPNPPRHQEDREDQENQDREHEHEQEPQEQERHENPRHRHQRHGHRLSSFFDKLCQYNITDCCLDEDRIEVLDDLSLTLGAMQGYHDPDLTTTTTNTTQTKTETETDDDATDGFGAGSRDAKTGELILHPSRLLLLSDQSKAKTDENIPHPPPPSSSRRRRRRLRRLLDFRPPSYRDPPLNCTHYPDRYRVPSHPKYRVDGKVPHERVFSGRVLPPGRARTIVDFCLVSYELDILEARLYEFSHLVDYFVIFESSYNHRGWKKPRFVQDALFPVSSSSTTSTSSSSSRRFARFLPQIIYIDMDECEEYMEAVRYERREGKARSAGKAVWPIQDRMRSCRYRLFDRHLRLANRRKKQQNEQQQNKQQQQKRVRVEEEEEKDVDEEEEDDPIAVTDETLILLTDLDWFPSAGLLKHVKHCEPDASYGWRAPFHMTLDSTMYASLRLSCRRETNAVAFALHTVGRIRELGDGRLPGTADAGGVDVMWDRDPSNRHTIPFFCAGLHLQETHTLSNTVYRDMTHAEFARIRADVLVDYIARPRSPRDHENDDHHGENDDATSYGADYCRVTDAQLARKQYELSVVPQLTHWRFKGRRRIVGNLTFPPGIPTAEEEEEEMKREGMKEMEGTGTGTGMRIGQVGTFLKPPTEEHMETLRDQCHVPWVLLEYPRAFPFAWGYGRYSMYSDAT